MMMQRVMIYALAAVLAATATGGVRIAAPVGKFTATCVPLSCIVDASASTGATHYNVQWGIQGVTTSLGANPYGAHTYAAAATYTVRLIALDDNGGQSVVSQTVIVPPVPVFHDTAAWSLTLPAHWGNGIVVDSASAGHPRSVYLCNLAGNLNLNANGSFNAYRGVKGIAINGPTKLTLLDFFGVYPDMLTASQALVGP